MDKKIAFIGSGNMGVYEWIGSGLMFAAIVLAQLPAPRRAK